MLLTWSLLEQPRRLHELAVEGDEDDLVFERIANTTPHHTLRKIRDPQVAKRILIADDHKSVLRGVRAMLESHPGWEVCGDAESGREVVGKAIELKPDLIVLDYAMPEWNGLKAADEISKVLPGVKIVLHTIYWSAVGLEAKKHGICRVVEKAKTGALVSTIDELIDADAA